MVIRMLRTFTFALSIAALGAATARAQPATAPAPATARPGGPTTITPQPASAPVATPAPAPRREGQPVNIKVEVTITDQRGASPPMKKTVTVVAGDNLGGFIRSQANYTGIGFVPLNVDVEPRLLADNKIRLTLNLQYNLPAGAAADTGPNVPGAGTLRTTDIHENLALILENGKPMVAAQSADPVGDRQVTIEVKATVLR